MTKTAAAMGNWWLAALSWQRAHSCITSCVQCFSKTSNHPGDSTPYSPDLTPCDFWFFRKLKSPLKGKRFQTINEIWENTREQLMVIPAKDIAECFEQWKGPWENYVRSQVAYFEGDWVIIVLCTMFLVSCIFNKCFYFSYYMAGYFQNRHICIIIILKIFSFQYVSIYCTILNGWILFYCMDVQKYSFNWKYWLFSCKNKSEKQTIFRTILGWNLLYNSD